MFNTYSISLSFVEKHSETLKGVSIDTDLHPLTVEDWLSDDTVDYSDILSEVFRGVDQADQDFFEDLASELSPEMLMDLVLSSREGNDPDDDWDFLTEEQQIRAYTAMCAA